MVKMGDMYKKPTLCTTRIIHFGTGVYNLIDSCITISIFLAASYIQGRFLHESERIVINNQRWPAYTLIYKIFLKVVINLSLQPLLYVSIHGQEIGSVSDNK